MRKTEMKTIYPLPWRHDTNGRTMSAVVAANGKVVAGSLICEQARPAADRQAHAMIVAAVNAHENPPASGIRFTCHGVGDLGKRDLLRRRVSQWAARRAYPIRWAVDRGKVVAWVNAPTTKEHNRAVRSLARIVRRHEGLHPPATV